MTKLSVNLNKVALLRNQRDIGYPSVVQAAKTVLEAGAHGITVHPRPDERHIRKTDIQELSEFLAGWPDKHVEFNIEGYPSDAFLDLVTSHACDQVTLVPDDPNQRTSDHGWNIQENQELLKDAITRLHADERRVSLFIDADKNLPEQAKNVGADRVEFYTGPYAFNEETLEAYIHTAEACNTCDIMINAGHDLNLDNLAKFIAAIPDCAEVSIGHAITADALDLGWNGAVHAYLTAIEYGIKAAEQDKGAGA